jgi:hypothetical protein
MRAKSWVGRLGVKAVEEADEGPVMNSVLETGSSRRRE